MAPSLKRYVKDDFYKIKRLHVRFWGCQLELAASLDVGGADENDGPGIGISRFLAIMPPAKI